MKLRTLLLLAGLLIAGTILGGRANARQSTEPAAEPATQPSDEPSTQPAAAPAGDATTQPSTPAETPEEEPATQPSDQTDQAEPTTQPTDQTTPAPDSTDAAPPPPGTAPPAEDAPSIKLPFSIDAADYESEGLTRDGKIIRGLAEMSAEKRTELGVEKCSLWFIIRPLTEAQVELARSSPELFNEGFLAARRSQSDSADIVLQSLDPEGDVGGQTAYVGRALYKEGAMESCYALIITDTQAILIAVDGDAPKKSEDDEEVADMVKEEFDRLIGEESFKWNSEGPSE